MKQYVYANMTRNNRIAMTYAFMAVESPLFETNCECYEMAVAMGIVFG